MLIGSVGIKNQWNLDRLFCFFIQQMYLPMSSGKGMPFLVGLNIWSRDKWSPSWWLQFHYPLVIGSCCIVIQISLKSIINGLITQMLASAWSVTRSWTGDKSPSAPIISMTFGLVDGFTSNKIKAVAQMLRTKIINIMGRHLRGYKLKAIYMYHIAPRGINRVEMVACSQKYTHMHQ